MRTTALTLLTTATTVLALVALSLVVDGLSVGIRRSLR